MTDSKDILKNIDFKNLNKTDLHIHTYYSDGLASPASIVETASKLGYTMIAITDHDGINGVMEALDAAKGKSIKVIPGIELAAKTDEGIGFHILGYGIDIENTKLKTALSELAEKRHLRNEKLIAVLRSLGYDICMEELAEKQPREFIGKPVIARALVEKGYIGDYREAFKSDRILGSKEARAIKKDKLLVKKAISLINDAGGKAVMAHPIQTRKIGEPGSEMFYKNIETIIAALKTEGLAGLECHHPDQDKRQTIRFRQIAENNELYITRGSDFHGIDFNDADKTQ